jgi:cyanophycin synthetase
MIEKITVQKLQCLLGASAALAQKTARVSLLVIGDISAWKVNCHARLESETVVDFRSKPVQDAEFETWVSESANDEQGAVIFAKGLMRLCVAIQREARNAVLQGLVMRVAEKDDGNFVLDLALPYEREAVLKDALQWSLRWLMLWGKKNTTPNQHTELNNAYTHWLERAQEVGLAPNTLRFALAAYAKSWPVQIQGNMLQIGWGVSRQTMDSSFSSKTSLMAGRTARDKHLTSQVLRQAMLPVPPSARVADWTQAQKIAQSLGWPVVVKPGNQEQGIGVVPGIRDMVGLKLAYEEAVKYSPGLVIVEKHIVGDDYRLLVVNGRLLMATRRVPGGVIGDQKHTVAQLIEQINADPRRGFSKRSLLMKLALDVEAHACLTEQQLDSQSVPVLGQFVRLRRTANISTGATAEDVTHVIHPDNRLLAERAARAIGLDIAGVDFLCPDISRSWHEVGGGICEVNAQPGFRPHWLGDPSRDINAEVLDELFPTRIPRIPTAAITGTNGKTTTARMLHHIWQTAGKVTGVSTTQGVMVGQDWYTRKDLAGLPGAQIILNDPTVESVVLEMPRKGLILFGHPCDRYEVAALLNVQDDHIGVDGIETMEQMAVLKSEVLERASQAIVLNAEDDLSLAMSNRATCQRKVLVARNADNEAVKNHCQSGGEAIYLQQINGAFWIVLAIGLNERKLMPLHDIPATMNGLLRFNENNAMFAVALAWAQGLQDMVIVQAMRSFCNSTEQNPGRYNFIEGMPFQVLVDYAHNPDGLHELFNVAAQLEVKGRRVLVSVVGNRFREHLEALIPIILQNFDDIYISQDEAYFQKNAKGYDPQDPLGGMLELARAVMIPKMRDDQTLTVDRSYIELMEKAIASLRSDDLVVILSEPIDAMQVIKKYQQGKLGKNLES